MCLYHPQGVVFLLNNKYLGGGLIIFIPLLGGMATQTVIKLILYQAVIAGGFNGVGTRVYIEFDVNIFDMAANCFQIDKQFRGYLAAAFAIVYQFEYLGLSF